jgi:hypothetical protein
VWDRKETITKFQPQNQKEKDSMEDLGVEELR